MTCEFITPTADFCIRTYPFESVIHTDVYWDSDRKELCIKNLSPR